jgi:hypothetical protein
MININIDPLCKQAELYYYDILSDKKGDKPVPASVIEHVDHCHNCQGQLNRLESALSQAYSAESEQGGSVSATAAILQLHLAYIGRPVTCEITKPFLPTLLHPALRVAIPTPITAHLDNCEACSEDLKTIQRMNLSPKQLGRLSQLFAENQVEDAVSCSDAQAGGLATVLLVFRETNAGVLKHLCTCPDCRKALYQFREGIRKDLLHERQIEKEFPCKEVSVADVFDYGVPYGIDPAADEYGKFREPLAEHIRSCPACLAKIQQLHNTVYGIAERTDSDVVTICRIDESAKVQTPTGYENLYAGFPIRVEVAGSEDGATVEPLASTIDSTAALTWKVSTKNLKPLLKPAVAAAAVILIAVALFFSTPTAKAVTIEQIYKAIEGIKNVYIASSGKDQTEPEQELWVSKTLNIYMTKTEKVIVLWDIDNGLRKARNLRTGIIDTVPLADETRAGIERKMSGSLGVVPFYDISNIPSGSEWLRVNNDGHDSITKDVEVYDLIWTSRILGDSVVFKKWRVFVNPETNLPHRIEWYQKLTGDEEYALSSVKVVEQLDESQMRAVLKAAAF